MHGPLIIYGSYNALFPERNRCQEAMALCMRIKDEILPIKTGVIECFEFLHTHQVYKFTGRRGKRHILFNDNPQTSGRQLFLNIKLEQGIIF